MLNGAQWSKLGAKISCTGFDSLQLQKIFFLVVFKPKKKISFDEKPERKVFEMKKKKKGEFRMQLGN